MKNGKYHRLFFISLIIVISFIGIYGFYTKVLKKTYSREELVNNFIRYENDFQKLVDDFQSAVSHFSQVENYQISFGLGKDSQHISIILYPYVLNSTSTNIGSKDINKGSAEYNMILNTLNWDNEIVEKLEKQLLHIKCDVIRMVDYYGGCKFEIYPYQNGFSSYSYNIYDKPLSDSLMTVIGRTISNSNFGKRVVLNYTSCL
jgi:hypothetical protein